MLTTSENTMAAAALNGDQKPRKMRASCDACSRAKVKCDKARPACHRCSNMGICCKYSPSMRLGKPRKKRNPDGSIRRDVSPQSSAGLTGPRTEMFPRTTTYTSESSPEPTDPFFFGPGTPEYHYQEAFMANNFDGGRSPAYSEGASSLVGSWPPNDEHLMFNSSADVFAPMPQFLQQDVPFGGHIRSSSLQSQPDMFSPVDTLQSSSMAGSQCFTIPESPYAQQEKMKASPPPMVSAPLPTPPATATSQVHDCTQFAFQTLNSLYAPPDVQPNAGDFNGTVDGLPTEEAVISTNKSAVDKLYILLSCPCSTNPHFSTTISFTIVKILSWYQAIVGVHRQGRGSPLATQMESFPQTVAASAIFGLDENTARTNLVLAELRKVEKLIDKFSERYCKTANPTETGIEGGVYSALESMLRTRVRDTFQITMRTAPANIKRQVASQSHNRVRVNTL